MSSSVEVVNCPVCYRKYPVTEIESHANKCIFLNSGENDGASTKRREDHDHKETNQAEKRQKREGYIEQNHVGQSHDEIEVPSSSSFRQTFTSPVPLAEQMRPTDLTNYFGQEHVLGLHKVLRTLLEKRDIPSMILWGPPGCGKDIFLPHVESGTITLIGATTENPSFSLNSALLSRCRVIVLEKLNTQHIIAILERTLIVIDGKIVKAGENINFTKPGDRIPRVLIDEATVIWLAEMCDGDARVALNSLQLALQARDQDSGVILISLDDIKDGVKRSHLLYDRKGDEHYNIISAMHKSIRASDDNAALYWMTRMLQGGEDPLYIARRLVRAASEDIGLADPMALTVAVSAMQGCQLLGMPECDVLLAQCAVYLARAPKSREMDHALALAKECIAEHKGPLPSVPLHLRNAPTRLMKDLGYGKGYNMAHKDISHLTYMPKGLENVDFFGPSESL
ncbi:hypothetical protein B7P43_G15067 [Cryptotermes secundus]|uniref:ATPase WRNIP1 n=1 Tax=Cryptotermes secundus TaxID=105785 RepID=A0A2J7Q1L4_9NEOP|nr:hypothetical protein B7P43_G15067 [Cryptotermes secundus]